MKKHFSIGLLSLLTLFGYKGNAQKLNLASDIWPPFTNVKKEKSIALDIVHQALSQIDLESSTSILDFKDVIKGIEAHEYDGSAALWKTEEREQTMVFSEPYLQNQLVLVGNKNTSVNIKDLSGKKLGVIEGYAYDKELLNDKNIQLVFGKSNQENLEKLLSGDLDYFLVDNLLIQYMLQYQVNDVNKYLEISETPYTTKTLHFAINKNVPNSQKIVDAFNVQINKMMKDGSYNEIMGLNRISVDVDNDGVSEIILSDNIVVEQNTNRSYSLFFDQTKTEGFYFNGKHYPDWESVPSEYKNKIPAQKNQLPKPIGLQINI